MDDTARLVSELHDKLSELDGKVAAYQRDMLAQFHLHMNELLLIYPENVSNEVLRVIAASMSKYPALSPTRRDSGDQSPLSDDLEDVARIAWDGRKSPPPILYHTSGKPKEGPRSPHQREKEFQGLFTPSYLPLLDSSYNTIRSPPISPPPQTAPSFAPPIVVAEKVEEPTALEAATEGAARPGPVRSSTDRSMSSVESSGSETKLRRSALRRSSSSTKGSPRRVRFDFEGEEVLPSTSPEELVTILTLADEAETTEPQAELGSPMPNASAIAEGDESHPYNLGMSLLDVEGEEDWLPRPRKVSSTQALQALSRSPLDAGTTWTVVNPDTEERIKTNGDKEADGVPKAEVHEQPQTLSSVKLKPEITIHLQDAPVQNHRIDELLGSPIEELEEYHNEDDDSEEEFLSMSTKISRKTPSPVAQMPFAKAPAPSGPAVTPAAGSKGRIQHQIRSLPAPTANNKTPKEDDADAVFDFDDEGASGEAGKYLPDDDDNEDETPISERLGLRLGHAGSDATPPLEPDDRSTTTTQPPVSPSAVLFGASVGSYRGNPLLVNPINNAKLYDEIAGMKDVHFLVGSIDGRTGVDSADAGSYRASLARQVMGAPRSFTERFALEEAMERLKDDE